MVDNINRSSNGQQPERLRKSESSENLQSRAINRPMDVVRQIYGAIDNEGKRNLEALDLAQSRTHSQDAENPDNKLMGSIETKLLYKNFLKNNFPLLNREHKE